MGDTMMGDTSLDGGTIEMKVAIISDIHGERKKLRQVLESIASHEVDHIYCLGDLFECKISKANIHTFQFSFLDQVVDHDPKLYKRLKNISCIAGNQEERIRSLIPLFQADQDLRYYLTLPQAIELNHARLEHGHQFVNEDNWYPYPRQMKKHLLFFGHTHYSRLFQVRWAGKKWSPEKKTVEFGTPIPLDPARYWAVNVGSITGRHPEWVLYEEELGQITFFRENELVTN